MNKQTGLVIFTTIALAACSSTPSRQSESKPAVQIVESQTMRLDPTTQTEQSHSAPSIPTDSGQGGGYLAGDGPGTNAPADIDAIPDAVPRVEPLHRYANRPYVALGQNYTPQMAPGHYKKRGIASWYGKKFHGQPTSSGETYDMYGMTAAHPTLPIPSYSRVTNLNNHKSVVVRVNDRGPFLHGRIIDLSYTAAHKLGIISNGSSEVEVESLSPDSASTPTIAVINPVSSEALPPAASPAANNSPPSTGSAYLQLGAFKSQQGAESFLEKMRTEFDGSGKQVALYQKDDLVRVHIGPYSSAEEAHAVADKLQSRLGFKPLVNLH